MEPALSVSIDSMRYPAAEDQANLIAGLSFTVPPQGFVSFLGRTGVGKTTLLRIIAGLERRFHGRVTLHGQPVLGPSRAIQLVFQDFRLLPWKTVRQNVEFAVKGRHDAKGQEQVQNWIRIAGLATRCHAWPKTLSGGEKGRTAFARAFVDQPALLLLDEPFRGLDLATRSELQGALLRALRCQPAAVVLVSHSVEDAVLLSDTVHVLTPGPMRIERSLSIMHPHPRNWHDGKLRDLASDISEYIISQKLAPQQDDGH